MATCAANSTHDDSSPVILDIRQLDTGTEIRADICIVGAGAAGIALAKAFVGTPTQVCMLESGGMSADAETESLNQGSNVGLPYFSLTESRQRCFGGATNRWTGWCRPLDPVDFRQRDWLSVPGWPIDWADLEPYYNIAGRLCQLRSPNFDPAHWQHAIPELFQLPDHGDDLRIVMWQGSPPTKFAKVYGPELNEADNVRLFLHANVVDIETNDSASVATGLDIKTLDGQTFRATAKIFVLAAGALETARLLMSSHRVRPAGLGNDHDNVGRYFMEHPHLVTGRIELAASANHERRYCAAIDRGPLGATERLRLRRPVHAVKSAFSLRPAVQDAQRLLNYSVHFNPVASDTYREGAGYRSLKLLVSNLRSWRKVVRQIRNRQLPNGLGRQIKNVARQPGNALRGLYDEILRRPRFLELYTQAEQAPNPNSRVTLEQERDRLGMRRLALNWQLSSHDKDSIRRSQRIVAKRLEDSGIGRLREPEWLLANDESWSDDLAGGYHHLGTARMSESPRDGVVDPDQRVHGLQNLYVGDGAVFATGGFANPTLTIVALACRLADHLKRRLGA